MEGNTLTAIRLRPATIEERRENFIQAIIGCDEVLSKYVGPVHPTRLELAKLIKRVEDQDKL